MKTRFALIFALLPGWAAAQQSPPQERTVVVNATAFVEREPERAVVLLAVESTGASARVAAQLNATKMEALVAALRRLGLSGRNVRTTSYELQPEYAQRTRDEEVRGVSGPPRIVGYRAANMVQVTVDTVARVGGVIDASIQAGANRVAGLNFELRDPAAARVEALRLAVAKARTEAAAIAEAAGQRLGPPLNISTSGYAQPQPMYRQRAEMDMAASAPAPTPIEAGTLSVGASVTITYRLEGS